MLFMSKAKQFLLEAAALTNIEKVHVVPQRLTELKLFFIRNFRILNSRASFSLFFRGHERCMFPCFPRWCSELGLLHQCRTLIPQVLLNIYKGFIKVNIINKPIISIINRKLRDRWKRNSD